VAGPGESKPRTRESGDWGKKHQITLAYHFAGSTTEPRVTAITYWDAYDS